MSDNDFVTRVEKAVQETLSSKSLPRGARMAPLLDLTIEYYENPIPFTRSEVEKVRELAIRLLNSEEGGPFELLTRTLAKGGEGGNHVETLLERDLEGRLAAGPVAASLLDQAGVLQSDETPLYFDYGGLCLKSKKTGRYGVMFLTNKRIIVVGGIAGSLERTSRRFFYDDWKEKPHVSSLDYVYLDRLMNIQKKKEEIKAKYHTKYWEVKQRTFYGPYFFRVDLPSKTSTHEGDVDVIIVPMGFKKFGVPGDHQERRNTELFERITQLRSKT